MTISGPLSPRVSVPSAMGGGGGGGAVVVVVGGSVVGAAVVVVEGAAVVVTGALVVGAVGAAWSPAARSESVDERATTAPPTQSAAPPAARTATATMVALRLTVRRAAGFALLVVRRLEGATVRSWVRCGVTLVRPLVPVQTPAAADPFPIVIVLTCAVRTAG